MSEHSVWIVGVSVVLITYFIKQLFRWSKLPPGPYGLPWIGYAPFIPTQFEEHVKQLFKKYGKTFSMTLYGTDVIMMSDIDLIKQALMKESFNYRPDAWFMTLLKDNIFISWNGQELKSQRKFTLRAFKDLGKDRFEEAVRSEIEYLFEKFDEEQAKEGKNGVRVSKLLGPSNSNVLNVLIAGERFPFEHPTRKMLDDFYLPADDEERPPTLGILNYLPALVGLLMKIPYTKSNELFSKVDLVLDYIKSKSKEHEKAMKADSEPTNYMQCYLQQMKESNNTEPYFDHEHLHGCASAFFGAGSSTMKDLLEWLLMVMMIHPEVQEKMRQEIDLHVGKDRKICMQDKPNLPYCEAVLTEVERISSPIPLGLIHCLSEDSQLGRWFLPKGTHVIYNVAEVHLNPEYFPEPEKFKPERFLSQDGKRYVKDDRVIGFGTGKRSCPGEPLARIQVFLYTTSFIQKYHISAPKDSKYSLKASTQLLSRICKDKVRCVLERRH